MAAPVSGQVIHIDNTTNATSAQFQALLNASADGDTIAFAPGIYWYSNILLTKDVTLESDGGTAQDTILDGDRGSKNGILYNGTVYFQSNTVTIRNLTFRNGFSSSSNGGGAINSYSNITVISSDFFNDTAPGKHGGAINVHSGAMNITVTGSNFSWCSAYSGGAISSQQNTVFVNSSSFVNCHASSSAGAVYSQNGGKVTFSRFDNVTAADGVLVKSNAGGSTMEATENWWGTNAPAASLVSGGTLDPYLVLGVTATPSSITIAQTSIISANLSYDSSGVKPAANILPDGIPVYFTVGSGPGSVPSDAILMTNHLAATTFTPLGAGFATVNASVGGYNISAPISISSFLAPGFSGTPASGNAPLTVSFTDQSTGGPTGWAWYFGDENYTQAWTEMNASAGWTARSYHSSVAMPDGSIVLMGGEHYQDNVSPVYLNDTWRSTDKGITWVPVNKSSGWTARCLQSSVVMPDGSIVLTGGTWSDHIGNTISLNDTWRSTDIGETWELINASSGWEGRWGHSSVVLPDGSIVLTGGVTGGPGTHFTMLNDVWRSTDNGATWTRMNAGADWVGRDCHSSVVMPDGTIVLMGGYDANTGLLNDTWQSSDGGTTWTLVNASSGWSLRDGQASIVMPDNSILLIGGNSNSYMNDTWQSTDGGITWADVSTIAGWPARGWHSAVALPDGSIVLTGGFSTYGYNDTWRLQPAGSSLQNPSHAYTAPGDYSVALQVYDDGTYNSTRKSGYIHVDYASPVAGFTVNVTSGPARLSVAFTDTTANLPVSWNWSFGDGSYSDLRNPVHTFISKGNFTVVLTATNPAGSDQSNGYVNVTRMPLSPPAITSVTPASGYRNQSVSFSIIGSSFQPGYTTVEFRNQSSAHIQTTLTSVTATRINGTLAIPEDAPAGSWNIRVATVSGGENVQLKVFTISPITSPTVTSVTPGLAYQNSTIYFTITGTRFQTGTGMTTVNFTRGSYFERNVTINTVTATSINGTLSINRSAPSGKWDMSVKTINGGTSNTLIAPFTVSNVTVPAITSVKPGSAYQNSTVYFTITGTNFPMGSDMTRVNFTKGTYFERNVTINSVTPTSINGTLSINRSAPSGKWNVGVTTADGTMSNTLVGVFTVSNVSVPAIMAVKPIVAYQNSTVYFTITGMNFPMGSDMTRVNFTKGTYFERNVTINYVTPTSINGTLSINRSAPSGKWNVGVTTADGTMSNTLVGVFTVSNVSVPAITAVKPSSAYQNSTVYFTITGTNFPMGSDVTRVNFTKGTYFERNVTINYVTPTSINGTLSINRSAPSGKWNVGVTTVDGTVSNTLVNSFTVSSYPAPAIATVSPATGSKNTTFNFTVTGSNFRKDAGYTNVTFSNTVTGSTICGLVTSATATSITGILTVPADATGGPYDLTVTTVDGGSTTKGSAFSLNSLPLPVITSINQTSVCRNATVTFTIKGNYFQPAGGTSVRLNATAGPPIAASLISVTGTGIVGTFAIPANAATGSYRLDVFTLTGGTANKANAVTITPAPKPLIASVTPSSAYQNSSFRITVTGSNFQTGSGTSVFLTHPTGNTNLTLELDSLTPTRLSGTVTIPLDAPVTPLWRLNVTTIDGGVATGSSAITVLRNPVPSITSITPVTMYRGTTVAFTLRGMYFQTGGRTVVNLTNASGYNITTTLWEISPTVINGTVMLPAGVANGSWKVNVTTVNSGSGTKVNAVTVL